MFSKQKGFTLIELLVVIAIIGTLSSIVIASVNQARARGRDAKRMLDLKQVQIALALYYSTVGSYPSCDAFSVWNTTNWGWPITQPTPSCLYSALVPTYIPKLPVDPKNVETPPGNYLGDNAPADQAYVYSSNGVNYTLGTNLEKGGTANNYGNWQLHNY